MWLNLEHLRRYPTKIAIDALAKRFNFPDSSQMLALQMQDWEWEVADSKRIEEFLSGYLSGELTDDEKFTLMETILESCRDAGTENEAFLKSEIWKSILIFLEQNITLHIYTVWYWSDVEQAEEDIEDSFNVTPFIRPILKRHQIRFAKSTEL